MKKNILFIIPSLGAGGGEKSLVNLLHEIDYSKFNVDLFIINHIGLFMEFLPKEVNILPMPPDLSIYNKKLYKSFIEFLFRGKIILAYSRVIFAIINRIYISKAKAEQYSWQYIRRAIGKFDKKYDIAIGYMEKTSNYLCIDNVVAEKKIGWIHNDYSKLDVDKDFDIRYFKQLDYIITVSEECDKILKSTFPLYENKIKLIFNIVSKKTVEDLANNDSEVYDKEYVNILSIGRLHRQKGFDMALEACKLLIKEGYKIRWNIIGEGALRYELISEIKKAHLEEDFKLLGLKANPYPYIKNCDIYVQPSRFEGKSIAVDEAKILCKPIVVTNFSTAKDQIKDGQHGIIVEMNATAVAEGIKKIINNHELMVNIVRNLKSLDLGTENEIYKLYSLF